RAQSRGRSACAWDAVTLRQRLSGERSPRSSRYLRTPNPAWRFAPLPTEGPMALSRCPQKGERIEGLADDAEPTSNVAEAWGLITSDAMMRRSYRAISWAGIIEYLHGNSGRRSRQPLWNGGMVPSEGWWPPYAAAPGVCRGAAPATGGRSGCWSVSTIS